MEESKAARKSGRTANGLYRIFVSIAAATYGTLLLLAGTHIAFNDMSKGRIEELGLAVILLALIVLAGAAAGFLAHPKWAITSLAGNLLAFAIVCAMIPFGLTTGGFAALAGLLVPAALSMLSAIGLILERRDAADA